MQIAANGSFEPNVTGLLRCREWLVARQELATKRRIHMVYDFLAVATNLAIYAEIVFPKATSTAAFGFGKFNEAINKTDGSVGLATATGHLDQCPGFGFF